MRRTELKPVEPHLRARIASVADQYERLAADLRRALEEGYPELVEDMPLLEDFTVGTRSAPILQGRVTGHPDLADGEPTRTSALVLLSLPNGLARTESRWYRLGRRLEQDDLVALVLRLERGG